MSYRITLTREAQKSLVRINRPEQERIARAINELANDAHPADAKALQGSEGFLRIRVGDYRIVYCVMERPTGAVAEPAVQEAVDEPSRGDQMAEETGHTRAEPTEESADQMPEVRVIRIGHRRDVYRRPLPRPGR